MSAFTNSSSFTTATPFSTLLNHTNGTQNSTMTKWPYLPIQPKQGLILFLITLPGTLANIIAFLATVRLIQKQRSTSAANYLILALTLTDLYGIVFCTLPTLLCYLRREWVGGVAMCNFQGVSTMFASLASGSLATSMATERLMAVWRPFWYRRTATVKKTFIIIFAILLSAFVIAIIPLSRSGNFVRNLTGTFCTINWFARSKDNIAYAILYLILGVSLLIIVVCCNVKLAICLLESRKKSKLLQRGSSAKKLIKEDSNAVDSERKIGDSRSIEKQLAKTVALISLLFVICWAPFMIRIICNLTGFWVDAWVDVQVSRLLLFNFVLDPFLYTLSRKQCRDIIKGWFCCCCGGNKKRRTKRRSLFDKLLRSKKRTKSGSMLSTGTNASTGSSLHTASVQMSQLKNGTSSNVTPTTPRARDNSAVPVDLIVHASDCINESTTDVGLDDSQVMSSEIEKDTIHLEVDGSAVDQNKPKRHFSTSAAESKHPSKEKTKSVPDLTDVGQDEKDVDVKVDVAYMYDLAFKRQENCPEDTNL
eukprot:gene9780-10779_t